MTMKVDRSAAVKQRIREEAGRLFSQQGFGGVGVRDIATAAGVDPAIVIRHFGTKENLFVQTVELPAGWHEIMSGPLEDLPARLLSLMLDNHAGNTRGRGAFNALLRASDRDEVRRSLSEGLHQLLIQPLIARLSGPDAKLRAHLFVATIIGILTTTWTIDDDTILVSGIQDVADVYSEPLSDILIGRSK
ncbi:TetR/AcrR family transcriptional regulator [Paramicrobacterium chengjingii]|uniref:TetR/AcrR family transcriptional regulator n=1 Tax=Paramicrobacterium chengjingii TaxID=2769067 RepID=UPI00141F199C|nr:TetR/AcrR family transcriptional regulator [Microbacterium chengjingii]